MMKRRKGNQRRSKGMPWLIQMPECHTLLNCTEIYHEMHGGVQLSKNLCIMWYWTSQRCCSLWTQTWKWWFYINSHHTWPTTITPSAFVWFDSPPRSTRLASHPSRPLTLDTGSQSKKIRANLMLASLVPSRHKLNKQVLKRVNGQQLALRQRICCIGPEHVHTQATMHTFKQCNP